MIWIRLRKNKNAPATGRHNCVSGLIWPWGLCFRFCMRWVFHLVMADFLALFYLEIVNGTINKSGTLFFNDPLLLPVFPQSMLFVNERIQIGMV